MQSETPKNHISHLLASALSGLKLTSYLENLDIKSPESAFGDYSTNAALVLAKKVNQKPQEVAAKIIEEIKKIDVEKNLELIEEKAGFINFKFSEKYLQKNLQKILEQGELYGASLVGQGKKVVFEYSSPNTNKPLHIGHTRNDTYGAACIRLLKSQGYKVVSCEIINDRGIHIMKSVLMYQKYGEGKTPESEPKMLPDHFVGKFYQMFAEKASESEAVEKQLLEEAQSLLQKWEAGDKDVREVWEKMNNWFFEGVNQTYEKEGSYFDEVDYESKIYDKGREVVLAGLKKGVFDKEADGSVSVDLTSKGLDKKYLLRKDGTTLYITQDMYLWNLRNEKHHPELAMVVTSSEQAYHFKVLSYIFELLEFTWAKNFKHLPYGHVFLGAGKMSSRSGNTITAYQLLFMVEARIKETMLKSEKVKASADNKDLVEKIAFGAIKYGFLKYEPNTEMYFDIDHTISIEGNTGPYIQYAHARISSILKNVDSVAKVVSVKEMELTEKDLSRKLLYFADVIEASAKQFKPNLLCNYLYELAALFSRFYQEVPVLQEADPTKKEFRLSLISATAQVIKNGLYLLGIEAPEEM